MPNLREIRQHIGSVGSIAQVTRAMEMVAAAKQQKIQARVEGTRSFAARSWLVLNHLIAAAKTELDDSPWFGRKGLPEQVAMIVISSDRGMVGSYTHDLIKKVDEWLPAHPVSHTVFIAIGKMGQRELERRQYDIIASYSGLDEKCRVDEIDPIARIVIDGYLNRRFDQIMLAYSTFDKPSTVKPTIRQLLPVRATGAPGAKQYIFEPSPAEQLDKLAPLLIRFQIYEALIESLAAENVARRMSMHSATQNADELIGDLTLSYNKARQQSITDELTDILGGAAAQDEHRG